MSFQQSLMQGTSDPNDTANQGSLQNVCASSENDLQPQFSVPTLEETQPASGARRQNVETVHQSFVNFEAKIGDVLNFLSRKVFPDGFTGPQRLNLKRYASNFFVKDGSLYRSSKGRMQKVVTSLAEAMKVFGEVHALGSGGHTGMVKTRNALASRFYWLGMSNHIDEWVSTCEECQKGSDIFNVDPVLHSIKVSKTWELVGIDLLGPLPRTPEGYQYILTATDYYSKWMYAYPLQSKSAVEVAKNLVTMIYEQGCPQRILSDQGTEFVNRLNMDLCKSLQIERSVAAAYHPQTNGLDEKTNHNIKRALLKVVNEKQNNWNQFLLPILFSLRSKKHSSTNFTPFQLMYGREAVFPCELPVTYALDQILMAEESDYVKGKEEQDVKRKETRARVAENVGVAQRIQQDTYKKRVLKRSRNMSVNVGDKVLLLNARNKSRKGGVLETKCLGPYIIRSLEGKKVYLTTMEGQDLRKMININHIKLFRDKVTQQDSTAADHQDMQVPGNTEDSNTAEEMQTGEDEIESLETEISTRVEHEGDKPCSSTSFPPRLEAMVGPHKIYDTSLHILQNRGWISDEVIDAYLHVLILKMQPALDVKQVKFQAISSCVATSILGGRYRNASYKKFPLQNSDELLCPYNTGNHWMIVIIALKDRNLLLIDPMGEEGQHSRRILQNWKNFLRSHFPENLTSCSWKVEHCAHETQQDGFNCGPLILKFAETYLCGGDLKDVPTKTSDLDDFRNHIAMELMQNSSNIDDYCMACNLIDSNCLDEAMVQCEQCKRWAHFSCLPTTINTQDLQLQDFHFQCWKCTKVH